MADISSDCPGCGVPAGQPHEGDCEEEQCPACGFQKLSCGCGRVIPDAERMPWPGWLPGVAECREYGLWSKLVPGRGWVPCRADEPGAYEDLLRLVAESRWDREKRRWVWTPPAEEPPSVPG
jgi:hypothetical protein